MVHNPALEKKRDRTVPPGVLNEDRRTIRNPVTDEIVTFDRYGYETNGDLAEATIVCLPGGGPPIHYHTTYNERFEVLEGEATIFVGGPDKPRKVNPGESVFVPMGTQHRFTSERDHVRMKGQVIPASAGFERSLYILFGLAEDGLVNKDGLPFSIIHLALIGDMSDMKFPGVGGFFTNYVTKVLAWYGRISGEEDRLLQKYWD